MRAGKLVVELASRRAVPRREPDTLHVGLVFKAHHKPDHVILAYCRCGKELLLPVVAAGMKGFVSGVLDVPLDEYSWGN